MQFLTYMVTTVEKMIAQAQRFEPEFADILEGKEVMPNIDWSREGVTRHVAFPNRCYAIQSEEAVFSFSVAQNPYNWNI